MKNPLINDTFIAKKLHLPIGYHPEKQTILFEENGSGLMIDHGFLSLFAKENLTKEEYKEIYNNITWLQGFYRKVMFILYLNEVAKRKYHRNLWEGVPENRIKFVRDVLSETVRARFAESKTTREYNANRFVVKHNVDSLVRGVWSTQPAL